MLTVNEALQLVIEHAGRQPVVRVPLDQAVGLVLAEDVVSDIDSPPFTKSLMDGYAVRAEDVHHGSATLQVLGEITAGTRAEKAVGPGETYRIMTGAPIPPGADSVVMIERTQENGSAVKIDDPDFRPGQNIMEKGLELRQGQTVLQAGTLVQPAVAGLLGTVGYARPSVYRRPKIAILSTGDEVIAPEMKPASGQIRNSNATTLWGLASAVGADVLDLGIARDDLKVLERKVVQGLAADVLLLTGGVSAGTKDFVPSVLAGQGVQSVFHKVAFKPGKPVWFGKTRTGLVFGLPGNPVSVLVCFELFVKTALRARQGLEHPLPNACQALLAQDFPYPTKRETFHPARVVIEQGTLKVAPVQWHGSPDLKALTAANALLRCPVNQEIYKAGDIMDVYLLSSFASCL